MRLTIGDIACHDAVHVGYATRAYPTTHLADDVGLCQDARHLALVGVHLAEFGIAGLEALQKAWNRARADGEMPADSHIAFAKFAGDNLQALLGVGIFDP